MDKTPVKQVSALSRTYKITIRYLASEHISLRMRINAIVSASRLSDVHPEASELPKMKIRSYALSRTILLLRKKADFLWALENASEIRHETLDFARSEMLIANQMFLDDVTEEHRASISDVIHIVNTEIQEPYN